ncbi:M48 family metallopeptidase [Flavobacteriaceae bacterium 14752]|uniref:M48 family metallopeptidase n=1 Tax=Mesohalobacter salilacus TaxID=2491711 RepID=UPI000F63EEA4|nr:M48 family peptidase [Flavobacteriaceae bacterium 14752]
MSAQLLFYIIIGIVIVSFIFDQVLDYLNTKHFNDPIPDELSDVYDDDEYQKSQNYKTDKNKLSLISDWVSFVGILVFLFLDGFAFVDDIARDWASHPITIALIFFGILMLASDIISTPFSYYSTFVIEEKYGFNKMTPKIFWLDKLKGWLLGALIGGALLSLIIWFYLQFPNTFWIYAWILISVFSLFINMFYAKLIVPLFNKQTPLEDGSLREKIEAYANKVGFKLDNIYVIDGSKRSTKANAYFSGFGSQKRITLYDTLIKDLDDEEIVAVLAHEVGHYKHKHIVYNLTLSIISTGLTLWLLSLMVGNPLLYQALGVEQQGFHIGLIAFGLLYSPISTLTGFLMNILSRKFEYQADNFAKNTYAGKYLISSLKKLSQKSLSNLTPHPLYVKVHYSHPSLLQRVKNLKLRPSK